MTTLCLIQARWASRRLPGKIAADIGGEPMLARVMQRVAACGLPYYVAFPQPDEDESDVLSRFARIAKRLPDVDTFVRVTADCPLLDPGVVGYVCGLFRQAEVDFCGTAPEMDGLDVEVFTRDALMHADLHATGADREHVTPWIRRNMSAYVVNLAPKPLRWSVDDEAGMDFARSVYCACTHCSSAVPHHTNAVGSIGGSNRQLCVDLHQLDHGGLDECRAADLKYARMGDEWRYESAR